MSHVYTRGKISLSALAGSGVLLLALAAPAMAQAPAPAAPAPSSSAPAAAPSSTAALPSVSHLQAARDVVVLSGVSNSFTGIFTDFTTSLRQTLLTRPETRKDLDEVLAKLKPESDKRVEDMIITAARVFANRMSEADLKEVQAFFNSPVGRRFNSSRPQMIDEVFTQLQPWTFRTSDFLYNSARDEMKKRGHDIGG